MSDETRTVTVESLAAALDSEVPAFLDIVMGSTVRDELAAAILAALPVATAGPEPDRIDSEPVRREVMAVLKRWELGPEQAAQLIAAVQRGMRERDHTTDEQTAAARRKVPARQSHGVAALRGTAAQADGGEPRLADIVDRCRQHIAGLGADLSTIKARTATSTQRDEAADRAYAHLKGIDDVLTSALAAQADTAPGGGLDAAWAAAEAALPEGPWWLYLSRNNKGIYGAQARTHGNIAKRHGAGGTTPAAALLALAARLASQPAAEPVADANGDELERGDPDPQDNRWDLAAKAQRDGDHAEPPVSGAARQAGGGS